MLLSRVVVAAISLAITAVPAFAQQPGGRGTELTPLSSDRARLDSLAVRDRQQVSVLFEFEGEKADITPEGRASLDQKIPLFRASPGQPVRIIASAEGGSAGSSPALDKRRVLAARRYLIAHGIDAGRISVAERMHSRRDELEIVMPVERLRQP